jgi:monovalent cation:proton antiporter-2 (CPA2) family protein
LEAPVLAHLEEIPLLREIMIFLVATAFIVPLFQKMKWSAVLGYLVAGVAIGPYGFAVIDDVEEVQALGELGVIFLLFTIGLELSYERIWAMRKAVFGIGLTQVVVTGFAIAGLLWVGGITPKVAIIIGFCLALSSTAMVMQLFIERGEIASWRGRTAFSILLFQDLAVVPLLFMVNIFGSAGETDALTEAGLALGKAVLTVGGIIIVGRMVLRPLFRHIAGLHNPEIFMAVILLVILGTAMGTGYAGLSMALGAFLAGLLIAETEYRHQVEIDIQPFKGLLLGLFFMSVGMAINFQAVAPILHWILLAVAVLMALKALIIIIICLCFRMPANLALHVGLALGQGGEFAFIVIGAAMASGIITNDAGQIVLIIAGLSMLVTPLVSSIGRRIALHLENVDAQRGGINRSEIDQLEAHVIIVGFGRGGQTVAKLLDGEKIPYVALDLDLRRITECRKINIPVFYGDARRKVMLEKVGAGRAASVVVTLDTADTIAHTVKNIRQYWPALPVYARARDVKTTSELVDLGASLVVPDNVESSLQLGGQVLNDLGMPAEAVADLIVHIRESDYTNFKKVVKSDEKPTVDEEPAGSAV